MQKTYAGLIAIVGRPNVGKSTLINALIGEKISITANKPQTTRHRILGIQTEDTHQITYVDTPGLHRGQRNQLNRCMNRVALSSFHDVDAIAFVIDAHRWTEEDEWILKQLHHATCPIILLLNKVDQIKDKSILLPLLEQLGQLHEFEAIIPISAMKKINLDQVSELFKSLLQEGPFYFPADQVTDRSQQFLMTEIIREKLIRFLGEELPHTTAVVLEEIKEVKDIYHLHAIIWVERLGQKKIVIGEDGQKIKRIGIESRRDLEQLLGKKVFLRLWVKVKPHWSDDSLSLRTFGYDEG